MKFNDEQKELIALLPQNANDYKLTDSAKLIWAQLIFMYGMDFAEDNGFVYRTNLALMEDTGIKSEMTILKSIRQLEEKGIIATKRGKRGEASEYVLLDEKYSNEEKNIVINYSNKSENYSNKIEDMELTINDLVKRIEQLEQEIIVLKKYSNEIKKYSTDTDTESDKEKESDQEIDDRSMNEKNKIEVNTPIAENKNQSSIAQSTRIDINSNFVDIADAYGEALDNLEFGVPIAENKSNISSCKSQRMDSTSKNEINEKFSRLIEDIKDLNVVYSAATTKEAIDGYYQEAANLTSKFNEMADKLTDRQLAYGQSLLEKTVAICGRKDNYLAAIAKSIKNTDIVQTAINQASDVYSDDEWASKVEHSFNSNETTKDNSSDSSKEEELKPQKSEEEELNDHIMKMFKELDEQDKTLESKVQSTLSWDTLPF